MVTEPDLTNGLEAAAFVKELRQILLAIGTCDGNIQGTYIMIGECTFIFACFCLVCTCNYILWFDFVVLLTLYKIM